MAEALERPVRVAVLGSVLVAGRVGDDLVEPASPRAKAFVVALALAPGESVSTTSLIDDLWGDAPPQAGKAALQTLVSRLRQVCADDIVVSSPGGYALGPAATTDLQTAERSLRDARRSADRDPRASERIASSALALWRGGPGVDLPESEPGQALAAAARRLEHDLLRLRAENRLALREWTGCLADLDALGETASRDDELVALRLRALDGSGRRSEALRVFADFRQRLADELGTDPAPDLVRLHVELLRDPASRPDTTRQTIGLRQAPNALIGRDGDIDRIEELLGESRLVTILGPGGLGKTRLAQEIGRRASETMPGVVVVELAGVRAEEDVVLALATTLGIREAKVGRLSLTDQAARLDARESILAALSERPTLLVVDNCEHVIDAAAKWIADILASTTAVRVVATSRAPLMIGAERVHPLDPLGSASGATGADGPAVRLFRERALAARPAVSLPADVVARLCDRLDGLPLAIELAAARVRSLSVDEIERRLSNRFALLTGGDRTAPERHRTLTAVIDWSWNLLGADERALLRRLSRFPDGFGAGAAQAVGADHGEDVTDALDGLVAQSLVAVTDDDATGGLRYRMLETVREFGDRELLAAGEAERVEKSMFAWAEDFCSRMRDQLDGSEQLDAFGEMALEQDNLATILRRALDEKRPDVAVTVFAALGYFWSLRGNQSDVASFGTIVLDVCRHYEPDEDHVGATALTLALGGSIALFGVRRVSHPALSRLRKLHASGVIREARLVAMLDILLAAVSGFDRLREILPAVSRSGDPVLAQIGGILHAQMLENRGLVVDAAAFAQVAYESAVSRGHVWAAATAASLLAELHTQRADPEGALVWAVRASEGLEAIGARADLQGLRRRMASAEIALGRFDVARATFEGFLVDDAEEPADDREDFRLVAVTGLAEIAHREGRETASLAGYDEGAAMARATGRSDFRRWPQVILSSAASVAAHAVRETAPIDPRATDALATSLRVRVLAIHRVHSGFEDVPVIGAAAFALGAWLLWPARATTEATRTLGLRLVFLAVALNSRQDFGSLETNGFVESIGRRFGPEIVDDARRHDRDLTPEEALAQVHVLFADRRLRRPFDAR